MRMVLLKLTPFFAEPIFKTDFAASSFVGGAGGGGGFGAPGIIYDSLNCFCSIPSTLHMKFFAAPSNIWEVIGHNLHKFLQACSNSGLNIPSLTNLLSHNEVIGT